MLNLVQYAGSDGSDSVKPSTDNAFFESLKDIVRLDGYAEDETFLKLCLDGAFDYLDGVVGYTSRALLNSIYELTLDGWPSGAVKLNLPPLQEVLSVKITNPEGTEITLVKDTDYRVQRVGSLYEKGRIVPVSSWPSVATTGEAIKIRFIAGQAATPSELPDNVKAAVNHLAAHRYHNREELSDGPSTPAFKGLLHSISLVTL